MATQTKRNQDTVEQTVDRIRELNERIIESSRSIGETYLEAYERTLHGVADLQDRVGAASQNEWVSQMAHAQADFTRQVTDAYTSASRSLIADRN